jgi:hypothetical protein
VAKGATGVCLLLTPHKAFKRCGTTENIGPAAQNDGATGCIGSNRRQLKYLNLESERASELIEVKAQLLQFSEYARR